MDSGLRRNGDLMAKTPGTERYRATRKIRRILHPALRRKNFPKTVAGLLSGGVSRR